MLPWPDSLQARRTASSGKARQVAPHSRRRGLQAVGRRPFHRRRRRPIPCIFRSLVRNSRHGPPGPAPRRTPRALGSDLQRHPFASSSPHLGFLPNTRTYSASPPLASAAACFTQSSRSMRPENFRWSSTHCALGLLPGGDLGIGVDAELVEDLLDLGADAGDQLEIIGLVGSCSTDGSRAGAACALSAGASADGFGLRRDAGRLLAGRARLFRRRRTSRVAGRL